MTEPSVFPTPDVVRAHVEQHGSIAAAARALGLRPRTLQQRVQRGYLGVFPNRDPSMGQELKVIVRDYSHLDHLYLYPVGDIHVGADTHDEKRFQDWMDYLVANPNTSMLGMGDHFNAAIVGSKSDIYTERMTVAEARRYLLMRLEPLAAQGRLDGLFDGNHEDRITRAVGDSPNDVLAEQLGVPYVQTAALYVYKVGGVEYEVYARHGTGNSQSLAQLYKGRDVASADLYLTAHTHRLAVTADEFFVRVGDRLERRRRYYASGGSFLGYEGYAAARGYGPSRLGAARIYFDGNRRDIHASI